MTSPLKCTIKARKKFRMDERKKGWREREREGEGEGGGEDVRERQLLKSPLNVVLLISKLTLTCFVVSPKRQVRSFSVAYDKYVDSANARFSSCS